MVHELNLTNQIKLDYVSDELVLKPTELGPLLEERLDELSKLEVNKLKPLAEFLEFSSQHLLNMEEEIVKQMWVEKQPGKVNHGRGFQRLFGRCQ